MFCRENNLNERFPLCIFTREQLLNIHICVRAAIYVDSLVALIDYFISFVNYGVVERQFDAVALEIGVQYFVQFQKINALVDIFVLRFVQPPEYGLIENCF